MALSLYPILFLVSRPVTDLLMSNGHFQQSCPIMGIRQIFAGFGSRLQLIQARRVDEARRLLLALYEQKQKMLKRGTCLQL